MTDKSTAAVRELVERWMGKKHPITMRSYVSDLTALIEEHYVKKEEHEKLVNAALQNKPQPTAEGAEEIEAELRGYARDIVRLHKPIMEVNPQLAMDSIGNDLVKMFNRLAQRIAEKMVSERLREELIKYDLAVNVGINRQYDNYEIKAAEEGVDDYLKRL